MLVGIVGKANVGKSTFFKAATLAEVEIANYPFATIKPNHGTGYVKVGCADKHFNVQCNPRFGYCIDGIRFVPVDLLDVAGLVPGAHEGKGMGNQFLDDLRQADVLIHVVDISGSTNEGGEPVNPGEYDPAKDINFLEKELDFWYLGILKKGWQKFAREIQQTRQEVHKALAKQLSGVGVEEDMIEGQIKELELDPSKPIDWSEDDLFKLAKNLRKITKPMIIACNKIDVPGAVDNFTRIENEFPDHMLIACSAESELALKEAAKKDLISYIPGEEGFSINGELGEKQKKALEFIKENSIPTGVQKILDEIVFDVLDRIAVHPGGVSKLEDSDGNVLPDCFLMRKGSTALDFAFRLHTDFGKNFIRAVDVKTKKTIGKDHVLNHLDIVELICGK